ncbi:hypothetical protein L917_11857, partial [Phytophthora nicotianae]
ALRELVHQTLSVGHGQDWRGAFQPVSSRREERLERRFDTVEEKKRSEEEEGIL